MKYCYEELAKMIDHSLLHPTMTDEELEDVTAEPVHTQAAAASQNS